MFVSDKQSKKSFAIWRVGPGDPTRQVTKLSCFFHSEKKTFRA
jgi:hypothetical protein